MALVWFRLLGRLAATAGDRVVDLGPPQQQRVLAALLLEPGRVLSWDELVDSVWPRRPPRTARKALHVHVSNLRQAFAGVPGVEFESVRPGYALRTDPDNVDLHRFRRLVRHGTVEAVREALELWRGRPLDGWPDDPFTRAVRRSLAEERLGALEEHLSARIASGDAAGALPQLHALAVEHPLRERIHELLMRALCRVGRTSEALAVFQAVERDLLDELGASPGPALTALRALCLPRVPAQLPRDVPAFVGRGRELAAVEGLLAATGRVLVAGPPGIGKTALAVRAAHRVARHYPDGQLHADLRAAGSGPDGVLAGFGRALGGSGAPFADLARGRRLLVVLDDVAPGDAAVVEELLRLGPACGVVMTGPESSRVPGVAVVGLGGLPDPRARALFDALVGHERAAAEPEATSAILAACGGSPRAIRDVGRWLAARPRWSLEAVAARVGGRTPVPAGDRR